MIDRIDLDHGHGHARKALTRRHDREEIRLHLVESHHWPAVASYEATSRALDRVHQLMHDPARTEEATTRIRSILGMPPEAED